MAKRPAEIQAANVKLLEELCQPGDFLPGWLRAAVVRETFKATATCPSCREIQADRGNVLKRDLWNVVGCAKCTFHEPEECYGLGVVVHALCNLQNLMSEEWYHQAAEHVFKCLSATDKIPDTPDDRNARLAELIAVVGLAVGIRAFYRSLPEGLLEEPPIPTAMKGEPRFSSAAEVFKRLAPQEGHGWGVGLAIDDLKPGLMVNGAKFVGEEFSKRKFTPVSPMNKWAPALSTGGSFLRWCSVLYSPIQHGYETHNFMFKKAPGRALNRVGLEDVAAGYTTAIGCSF
ncbi:unnamed protein product [Symbiodinium microadriaticum]|nr:unnamed protein product [Symbiodinium microadriaticum]CAE7873276.1 unnamed protein product [Symbiodinium sp. KB8]